MGMIPSRENKHSRNARGACSGKDWSQCSAWCTPVSFLDEFATPCRRTLVQERLARSAAGLGSQKMVILKAMNLILHLRSLTLLHDIGARYRWCFFSRRYLSRYTKVFDMSELECWKTSLRSGFKYAAVAATLDSPRIMWWHRDRRKASF